MSKERKIKIVPNNNREEANILFLFLLFGTIRLHLFYLVFFIKIVSQA